MLGNLQIHALLEERTHDHWTIERAPAWPLSRSVFRLHLDLQIGPIFITIGDRMAGSKNPGSQIQFAKDIA